MAFCTSHLQVAHSHIQPWAAAKCRHLIASLSPLQARFDARPNHEGFIVDTCHNVSHDQNKCKVSCTVVKSHVSQNPLTLWKLRQQVTSVWYSDIAASQWHNTEEGRESSGARQVTISVVQQPAAIFTEEAEDCNNWGSGNDLLDTLSHVGRDTVLVQEGCLNLKPKIPKSLKTSGNDT